MRKRIRMALLDSRPLTLESLGGLLTARCRDFDVSTYPNSNALLAEDVDRESVLDMLMLNIGSERPVGESVHHECERLAKALPDTPMVLFCDHAERSEVIQALRYGVRAYIPTSLTFDVVCGVLRLVQSGGSFVPPSVILECPHCMAVPDDCHGRAACNGLAVVEKHVANDVAEEVTAHGFTARQLDVLRLLQQGKPNKVIAWELSMQESTAKVHVRAILKKLRATNRTEAAYLAQQVFTALKIS